MRKITIGLSALALAAVATPALAEEAPASEFTVTGGATVVTDYRFRGISQTDKRFAVQGTLGVSHASGLYVGVWGSSIDSDTPIAGGSDQEIDIYGGFKKAFGPATVDVGVLYYYYPGGNTGPNAVANTDFIEPYVSVSGAYGPVGIKVGAAFAPKQKALATFLRPGDSKRESLYTYGELSATLPGTPIALSAHLGHTFGPSYLTAVEEEYTDWSLGATYTWNHLTFGVSYVDTDFHNGTVLSAGSGRDITKAGVVGSIGVSF